MQKKSDQIAKELSKLSLRVQELEELGDMTAVQQYTYVSYNTLITFPPRPWQMLYYKQSDNSRLEGVAMQLHAFFKQSTAPRFGDFFSASFSELLVIYWLQQGTGLSQCVMELHTTSSDHEFINSRLDSVHH